MNRSHIGERIEQLRLHKGFSSQALARRIGKSQATVSRIENGKQGVSVEMLDRIARALSTSPYHLLSDLPPRHSTMLPPVGAIRTDGPIRVLASTLERGRQRCHLSREESARQLALTTDELEAIELGYALPDAETRRKMATLYTLDAKLLEELAALEESCPLISERMALTENLLIQMVRRIRHTASSMDDSGLARLVQDVQELTRLGPEALSAEREASYFSIGHLSDGLLQALQDPRFHEIAERLAAEYTETGTVAVVPSREIRTQERTEVEPL